MKTIIPKYACLIWGFVAKLDYNNKIVIQIWGVIVIILFY